MTWAYLHLGLALHLYSKLHSLSNFIFLCISRTSFLFPFGLVKRPFCCTPQHVGVCITTKQKPNYVTAHIRTWGIRKCNSILKEKYISICFVCAFGMHHSVRRYTRSEMALQNEWKDGLLLQNRTYNTFVIDVYFFSASCVDLKQKLCRKKKNAWHLTCKVPYFSISLHDHSCSNDDFILHKNFVPLVYYKYFNPNNTTLPWHHQRGELSNIISEIDSICGSAIYQSTKDFHHPVKSKRHPGLSSLCEERNHIALH